METLRELTEIVTPKKWQAAAREFGGNDGKMNQLYELVVSGSVQTDEEASARLFPGSPSELRYERLKRALKKKLTRLLFVIDLNLPHYQLRQQAYFESYRSWAALKLLIGKNARHATVELATALLKITRKYDFTDISLDITRALRLQYGSIFGDLKKYEQYGELAREYETLFQQENLAEELYTDLIVRFVNSKSSQEAVHEKTRQYFRQIEPALQRFDSYRLHLSGRLLQVLIHSSINDYKRTVAVCDEAIRFFEAKHYVANVPLQAFYHQAMVCYIQLRDYGRGQEIAARGMALLEEGTFNWFKYQELWITLALHTKAYEEAYQVFSRSVQHRNFATLPDNVRQVWKITEAYLFYLAETGRLRVPAGDTVFNRFRMARFVNETPLYAKDKRGLNIPILIFQILYLILTKRTNDTIDRMEAVEKYSTRYLKKDDTYRSNCFIKMLLQIPASGFHRIATIRHADKFARLLRTVPLDFANQSHDVEIIPYEQLWEMALDSLN